MRKTLLFALVALMATTVNAQTGQTVNVPDDLITETYRLTGFDDYWEEEKSRDVEVGIKDGTVYICGISEYITTAWIAGTLTDGKLTIPECYLGSYVDPWGAVELTFQPAEFDYDEATATFTSEVGYKSMGDDGFLKDEMSNVVIAKVVEVAATPADPSVSRFSAGGDFPFVVFNIPATDVDGVALSTSKLFYTVFVEKNGQAEQLTLTPDLYPSLDEAVTELPYDYADLDNIYEGGDPLFLNFDLDEMMTWSKIGVQSIYRGAGEEHKSAIGWFDLTSYWVVGIGSIEADESGNAIYFDLQGRQSRQQHGIVIKQTRTADGKPVRQKVAR